MSDVLLLSILLIAGAGLCVSFARTSRGVDWTHPCVLFAGPFLLYSIALPFSRLVLKTPSEPWDGAFMLFQLVALASFVLGFGLLHGFFGWSSTVVPPIRPPAPVQTWPLDLGILGSLAIHVTTVQSAGGVLASITMPYGYTTSGAVLEEGQISAFLGITALSALSILAYVYFPLLGVGRKVAYSLLIAFTTLTQFMSGSRNAPLWILFPLAVIWLLRGRRVSAAVLVSGALAGFAAMQVVAAVRQVGFGNLAKVIPIIRSEAVNVFDPVKGELGTSFNVYRIWMQMRNLDFDHLLAGRTLVIDPIVTLVPRAIWPTRPDNIAIEFSREYYGGLESGLGFSALVESLANFGLFGPFILFTVVGFGAAYVAARRREWIATPGLLASYALLSAASMNFNRIDMATLLKLFLMRVAVILVVDLLMRTRIADILPLRVSIAR